jgi:WD40 repeat protein
MASVHLQEKADFTRLSRLLVDKGTEALRNTLDAIHPPANLPAVLNGNKKSLLRLKFKVINGHQWDLLFPPSGNPPDSKTFDVTLLMVLLRNICGLPPPATGWNTMPPDTDRSPQANITRIKLFRNEVYAHVASTQVGKAIFENLWQKISEALVDLNIPQKEIDDLKTCPLGAEEEIYVRSLKEWFLKEEDFKNMLIDLTTNVKLVEKQLTQSNLQQENDSDTFTTSMQHLTQITKENRQGIQQLCQFSSMQNKIERPTCDSKEDKGNEKLLQTLAKNNFKSKIRSKVKSFHPGTRDWLLKKVKNWFTTEEESSLLLITGGPGFGKSVFAAKVCEIFRENGNLAACHFCDFSNSNLKDPMMMMQSLASQMCENVPGFEEKLIDQLKRPHKVNSLKDAFQIYFQNPLDELEVEPRLIVIDGLDESATDDKSDMVKLIADHFVDLPKCVKVLVTSRPEISIVRLSCAKTIAIDASNNDNGSDLLEYLKVCLPSLAARDVVNLSTEIHNYNSYVKVLPAIVIKCEGSFLYAFHVQHELCKREDLDRITLEEIMFFLPEGMGSVYKEYFHRLEMELEAAMKKKADLFKLLEMLVAIEIPLPLTFLSRAFDLALDCRETIKVIEKVNEAVSCLLFVSDDEVTVFHKSVYDWLLANGYKYHEYAVKVSDGKERLWLVCEQIFEAIRRNVSSGNELKLTKDVKHALDYGHKYLLACKKKDSFSWFVDMVIVHVHCKVYPRNYFLQSAWEDVLRSDLVISRHLRQRISLNLTEIRDVRNHEVFNIYPKMKFTSPFSYLEAVLDHSPERCLADSERKTADQLLAKVPQYVKRNSVGARCVNLLLAKPFSSSIKAVGVSFSKTLKLAAVALADGIIYVLSLPELVELWQYSTGNYDIPCCTFSPDDSFVLYGELEMALSVAARKGVSFFNGKGERFKSCSFSPSGNRLVTNDGSRTVKLWDVVGQCLLTLLCEKEDCFHFCRFSSTGLFIIADRKTAYDRSYCVWNSITFQRVDQRSLFAGKHIQRVGVLKNERCDRCFREERKELIASNESLTFESLSPEVFTGIYHGVHCNFYWYNQSLRVIEDTHFTTLEAWQIFAAFVEDRRQKPVVDITAIEDDLWLYGCDNKMIVFGTVPRKGDQSCLSRPSRVLWCSFSPDGTRLATCTSDGFVNLWNVDNCKVYQRFRSNVETSSAACFWSDRYLFVFHLNRREIPSLCKYPVDENLKIKTTQRQLVPLCPVANEFLRFPGIVDFSYGYLIFNCFVKEPVKVLDVNGIGDPKPVVLPEIESLKPRRIAVSAGASFVLGTDNHSFFLWKKSEGLPARYELHICDRFSQFIRATFFSHNSKYVVFCLDQHCVVIDINTGIITSEIDLENVPEAFCLDARVFCTNRVVIRVIPNLIQIYDLESSEGLRSSFQRNLTKDLVIRSKLSPKRNILAVPRLTGDMDFFQLCNPESSSVSIG